jgi:hypothetical protein
MIESIPVARDDSFGLEDVLEAKTYGQLSSTLVRFEKFA